MLSAAIPVPAEVVLRNARRVILDINNLPRLVFDLDYANETSPAGLLALYKEWVRNAILAI